MDIIDVLTKLFSGLSGLSLFIGLFIAWKTGFLDFVIKIKKNGSGSYRRFDDIDKKLQQK